VSLPVSLPVCACVFCILVTPPIFFIAFLVLLSQHHLEYRIVTVSLVCCGSISFSLFLSPYFSHVWLGLNVVKTNDEIVIKFEIVDSSHDT